MREWRSIIWWYVGLLGIFLWIASNIKVWGLQNVTKISVSKTMPFFNNLSGVLLSEIIYLLSKPLAKTKNQKTRNFINKSYFFKFWPKIAQNRFNFTSLSQINKIFKLRRCNQIGIQLLDSLLYKIILQKYWQSSSTHKKILERRLMFFRIPKKTHNSRQVNKELQYKCTTRNNTNDC